jgi:hypothetical protein
MIVRAWCYCSWAFWWLNECVVMLCYFMLFYVFASLLIHPSSRCCCCITLQVNWDVVRVLSNGEVVSLSGTHLGHNLPDATGNRFCINLVSIAGNPVVKKSQPYRLK